MHTLESLSRETTLSCPPSLPRSPFLPILSFHSPSTRCTTNRNSLKLNYYGKLDCYDHLLLDKNLAPKPKNFKSPPRGAVSGHQPTCLSNINCIESTTTEGTPVAESLPGEANGIENSRKKRQRQKHAQHRQQLTRAHSPGGRSPAKFGCQPIKLEQCKLAHMYPAN